MCGIVGAVAQRNVIPILLEGLHRLEYRGYDSAGLVTVNGGLSAYAAWGEWHRLLKKPKHRAYTGIWVLPTLAGRRMAHRRKSTPIHM